MGLMDGKVAIVTGGGRGIGRAEAMLLAAQGARVVVNDLGGSLHAQGDTDTGPAEEVAAEIRALGGQAVANTDDIGDWDGSRDLVRHAIDTYGSLDILVNNAGVIREAMSFNTVESDFDIVVKVHLKGTYATTRWAGEYWRDRAKEAGGPVAAAVVNTSSPNGLNGGVPGQINYAIAKSGVATMTIVYARELGKYGVRCNAIAPVAFTRMTESLWGGDLFSEDKREEMSPEGVASVVGWLASPLSDHVSGQIFGVHGGTCFVWKNWEQINPVATQGRWTIESLDAASPGLFAGYDPGIPPMV